MPANRPLTAAGQQHLDEQVVAVQRQVTDALQGSTAQLQALQAAIVPLQQELAAVNARQQPLTAAGQQYLDEQVAAVQRHTTATFQSMTTQLQDWYQARRALVEQRAQRQE